MAAGATGARSIPWINILNRNAIQLRLVFDKRLKLKERPTAMFSSFGFPNRRPFADVPEILQGNPASGVFGFLNELFSNDVVVIAAEPSFIAPNPLQVAAGATRTAGLQVFSQCMVAAARILNGVTRKRFTLRVAGNLHDAQIHANEFFGVHQGGGGRVDDHQQIEHTIDQNQIGLAVATPKLNPLVITHLHGNQQPALQGQQAGGFQPFETQNALIVNDRARGLEKAGFGLVALIGFNDLGNRPNRQLCRQAKLFSHVVIDEFLQNKLGGALFPKRHFRDVVTRFVKDAHGVFQHRVLGFIRKQFDLQDDFHIDDNIHKEI
jgi:hypothetical protein